MGKSNKHTDQPITTWHLAGTTILLISQCYEVWRISVELVILKPAWRLKILATDDKIDKIDYSPDMFTVSSVILGDFQQKFSFFVDMVGDLARRKSDIPDISLYRYTCL